MAQQAYIMADLLIDGLGATIRNAVIEITDKTISKIGNPEEVKVPDKAATYRTAVAMPGLWDCHTHFFGGKNTDMLQWMEEPTSLRAIRSTVSVKRLIEAGFTSVRDVGGPYGLRLKKAINEGSIPGPNVYAANKFISQTAGHGDNHPTYLEWQEMHHVDWSARLADGVDECRKATREQIREGADLIKIFVTGGVFSHIDDPHQSHFSNEELRAIIEEASRFDLPTSAHAHGLRGINAGVDAGITTIEHGSYIDEKTADKLVEKNVILVPTLTVGRVMLKNVKSLPESMQAKAELTFKDAMENVRIAIRRGVKVATGSDLLGILGPYQHGNINASELVYLAEAGLSPMQAIQAATSVGPQTLGKRAPNSGMLSPGKDADILCLNKNPLDNLATLQERMNIAMVFKGGKLVVRNGVAI